MSADNNDDWVDEEFADLNLGDKRVDKSGKSIIKRLANQPGASIPRSFETWSEAKSCYEFLNNGKVTAEAILAPHKKATIDRIKNESVILMPNDTSSLNYTSKPSMKNLGNIGNVNMGIFIHPLLAITPERVTLGIIDAKIWARESKNSGMTDHEIYSLPIEEKEKYRWIESYHVACKVAKECPNTKVIAIADREADFAELLAESDKEENTIEKDAYIIVRAYHNRALDINDNASEGENTSEDITNEAHKKLMDNLKAAPPRGEIQFEIPATTSRSKRNITQTIKASRVTFKKRLKNSKKITLNAVMAIEENPPEGVEPLVWVFLTTLPINSFEEIALVIKYYLARWEIEVFFKVIKSGCAVEERQIKNCDSLSSLVAIFMIIAWRIVYVMKLGRECPEMPCNVVFSESEWKSVYKVVNKGAPLPNNPPLMGEFIRMIAGLGGYLKRKNDPPPGPKAMWIGINRMNDFSIAWEIFGS